jgi:hypothetical protein
MASTLERGADGSYETKPCDNQNAMQSTVIIRKSPFGLFMTYLVGGLAVAGLLLGITVSIQQQGMTLADTRPKVLLLGLLVVVLATFIRAYVYMLSRIELTSTELRFVTWTTVLSGRVAGCEWRDVRGVEVAKAGRFSQAFDYGTLVVQTATKPRNLRISMIPNVEHWRSHMAKQANAAVVPVRFSRP